MALQTFTAGQVLTAAQVTALQANDYNQTVNNYTDSRTLTIADLGDRVVMNKATATTITVNTGIFAAGDTLWIHNIGAGVCTITAGTATVSSSGSLALAQNSGGTLYFTSTGVAIFFPSASSSGTPMGTLINTTSFSGVSSFSLPANTFSATYDNYKVIVNLDTSVAAVGGSIRMRASGTDNTSANYAWALYGGTQAPAGTFASSGTGALGTSFSTNALSGTYSSTTTIEVMRPFVTDNTNILINGGYFDSLGNYAGQTIFGLLSVTTSYDSLSMIPASGTFTGTYSVYGYNK